MKNRSHRLPTISDTPDDWVDESWTVDCVCGVNFDDGEEMVNCDECGVWVHTRCSQYVKSEKLFACDKCKSKKQLTNESEETEVAQLLVELPTKTLRMENSYSVSCPLQNQLQIWNEIPLEEKVHVQGIPGGDPALFSGLSSVFSPQLWKCTGYVPKKFNFQYREFPCWDERQEDGNNGKEDVENHASKGADALFLLSKDNVLPASAATKGQVDGGAAVDMGKLPSNDMKKQEVGSYESERQHSGVEKQRSLLKPIVIHSGKRKKDDSRALKDLSRKNKAKIVDKEDYKKGDVDSSKPVFISNDAKQPESQEAKDPKVVKTDTQSVEHGNSTADVHGIPKSYSCLDVDNNVGKTINNVISCGQPLEDLPSDLLRRSPPKDAKSIKENEGRQNFPLTKDVALSLEHKEMNPMKDEVGHDNMTDGGKSPHISNAIQPHLDDGKSRSFQDSKGELLANSLQSIEVKAVEVSHPGETSNSKTFDLKLDSSNSLAQDTDISIVPFSSNFEVKDDAISVSQNKKVQNVNKSTHAIHQADQPDEILARRSSSKSHGKPSAGKHSSSSSSMGISKPSVHDKSRYYNTENRNASASLKGSCDNKLMNKKDNTSSEVSWDGDTNGRPRKIAKDLQKASSTSALKSSHFSRSSHAPVPKKKPDLKDAVTVIPSSSKTSSLQKTSNTPDSGDSGSSLQGENKSSFTAPKNHPPSVHPPASSNSTATLSDEELALLLHQELNSSPRVPRVPRMRHAGSLPQIASPTPTSTLMKRTSSSGGKDNIMVSRKKDKDIAKDGPSNSHELDDGAKKVDRVPHLTNSRRHDHVGNGSARVVLSVDNIVPPASTTVSSDPSSSTEANEQNVSSPHDSPRDASDDDTGAIGHTTHRTLPVLIAEIMSKGKRMTYEELCNAVLPHWPNLRKHNGERYAYSSHSHAVLDCLRNRSEWSRLVDRGPKTNASRKRRKLETEENDDSNVKKMESSSKSLESEFPKGKRKARKRRRLALQGRGIKDVRRRQKVQVPNDDIIVNSSSSSSEESIFSDEEIQEGTSGSSDEMMGAMS